MTLLPPSGPGPDWNRQESGQVQSVTDPGETAARANRGLGSMSRSGHVVFMTSFSEGLGLLPQRFPIGSGASIVLNPAFPEYGNQSVKLTCAAANGSTTRVARVLQGGYLSRIGFEVGLLTIIPTCRFYLQIWQEFFTTLIQYELRFDVSGNQTAVRFRNSSGLWSGIPQSPLPAPIYYQGYHTLKLVVDTKQRAYVAFYLNGTLYDLSVPGTNVQIGTMVSSVFPSYIFGFKQESQGSAFNQSLGSWIQTIDEP